MTTRILGTTPSTRPSNPPPTRPCPHSQDSPRARTSRRSRAPPRRSLTSRLSASSVNNACSCETAWCLLGICCSHFGSRRRGGRDPSNFAWSLVAIQCSTCTRAKTAFSGVFLDYSRRDEATDDGIGREQRIAVRLGFR